MMTFLINLKNKLLGEFKYSPNSKDRRLNNLIKAYQNASNDMFKVIWLDKLINYCLKNKLVKEIKEKKE
jgi:hypothetical protein